MKFDNRDILMAHLSRGSRYCLLNLVLTTVPLSTAQEEARISTKQNRKSGFAPTKVAVPAFKAPWVCREIYGLQGEHIDFQDKKHPCRYPSIGARDVETEVENFDELV